MYSEIVADDAKDWQSQLRISQIYRQKKDFVKAREASAKAIAIEPKNLEVQYNEINILDAEGKTNEAIAALKESGRDRPRNGPTAAGRRATELCFWSDWG